MPHLCKDCIYCRPYEQGRDEAKRYELATCDKLSAGEISLVDGSQRRQDRFCENERRSLVGECGPAGKLFHPIGQPFSDQTPATDMSARMLMDQP